MKPMFKDKIILNNKIKKDKPRGLLRNNILALIDNIV